MSLVDRIVARRLFAAGPSARVLGEDRLESPWTYVGWLLPIRLLCALRYYRLKRDVLSRYAFARRIPPCSSSGADESIAGDLLELGCARAEWSDLRVPAPLPWWSWPLRAWIFYPAVLAACVFAVSALLEWHEREAMNDAMAVMVPNYANEVFERTALRVSGASDQDLARADDRIRALREQIAGAMPSRARSATERALLVMADDRIDDESVRREMLRWQDALGANDVPYFVEAHVHRTPCLTLIEGSFEMRAFAVALARNRPDDAQCRVTLLLPYHVRERERYASGQREHRVALLYRADTMPIRETALGVTHLDTRESHVFLDRVRRYTVENVMPALDDRGSGAMFPLWVTLTPDAERLTTVAVRTSLENVYGGAGLSRLRAAARNSTADDDALARARLAQTLHTSDQRREEGRSWEELGLEALSSSRSALGDAEPVRPLAPLPVPELEELEQRLVHAITYHELEHQLPSGPVRPQWSAAMEDVATPMLDPVARETSAYLRGLIAGEDIRHLLLAQLTSFVTNPLTQLYTERTASRMILFAMHDCQRGRAATVRLEPDYDAVMEALSSLIDDASDAELGAHASCAYESLFGRTPPELRPR